ncbi:MAG: ABC transporter ATP-binding protein [Chloroflexi bacterium]|nr:ABC transporter ATP-binding protein [Chloroflexota bacterium]
MIEVQGLSKSFGEFRAVDNVTFSVEPGTVFALLGPNGAGKTTTIRMLTSILVPSTGWATVAGYDVVRDAPQVRASVGVLTEQHGLYERMRGLEYLDFFGRIYRLEAAARRSRARSLMERFGLGNALDRRVGEYSKGMKQKLALVRALLHDPPVLLLDEPTSAMDPQSARLVRNAIKELRSDRRTIILTTHNLSEAQELSDRVAIIRQGRIIAHGDFEELARRVVGPPLMELRTVQPLNGMVEGLRALVGIRELDGDRIVYETANPAETNPNVLRYLLQQGVDVLTLSRVSETLESIYLNIVEEDEDQEQVTR